MPFEIPNAAALDRIVGALNGDHARVSRSAARYERKAGAWRLVDTGWIPLAPMGATTNPVHAGFTGTCEYRVAGDSAELRFDLTGAVAGDIQMAADAVAPEHRPGGPTIVPASAYLDPTTARASSSIYLSAGSGTLRGTAGGGPNVTRSRGRITWMVG